MENGVLQPGQLIAGKYVVERLLGRGGMGVVYVVAHKLTGKRLALKCLLPELVHNADIVERFLREAQATGRIEHRNVVHVFDVGREGDVLYLVMELLHGKALSELLRDETLTLEEALGIIVRAMEGVAAAHASGIVHRDLKPDNIFVCVGPSGRLDDPRVLDFGISKLDDSSFTLTRSGVAMGTPYYMCIEQLRGQRDIDGRVDVYALGVILYEAIAGVPPHVAESVSALAIRVLTVPPEDLHVLRPDLPEGLAAVVMKAIARDREDRHATVQALIDTVRPFVPRSAGLLVPEGQGRPLRTPRSASAASLMAASLVRESPVLTPLTRPAPARWLPVLVMVALMAGVGVWLSQRQPEVVRQAPAVATPPTLVDARSEPPAAKQQPVAKPQPDVSAYVPEPAPPATSAPPAATPSADPQPHTSQHAEHRRASRHQRDKTRGTADAATPVHADEPPVAGRAVKTVQGRAGQVSSDEF